MDLLVRSLDALPPGSGDVEVVERKGSGHPDTICDALAEEISVRLCRHDREQFGTILHHNVDKILLCAGAARPRLGGGEVIAPIEVYLGGRATMEYRGRDIPVAALAVDACRQWLRTHLHALDVDAHVTLHPRFRPGSAELTRLFGTAGPVVRANDTSCGAGFAPSTDLERVVLAVERALNSAETKRAHPAIGEDVKVMGVRRGSRVELTVGCAMIGRFLRSVDEYERARATVHDLAVAAAAGETRLEVSAIVNAADDLARGEIFLTVTGTSAEAGDDGEVGRGNRACGLITPYRPMTMEAVAGKNPVSHVGKVYNLAAARIAAAIVDGVPGVLDASCVLVGRIGSPIDEPQLVDVRLALDPPQRIDAVRAAVNGMVASELARSRELTEALLEGRIPVY
jgi:S-adenosylmethionine synthetase